MNRSVAPEPKNGGWTNRSRSATAAACSSRPSRRPHVARLGQARCGAGLGGARAGRRGSCRRAARRLADLHGLRLDADVRPATWRLGSAASSSAARPERRGCAPAARRAGVDFHCVTGWTVPKVRWAGVRISDLFAKGASRYRGARAAVRLGRGAVLRLPDDEAGAPPRRDARIRDGREAAPREHGAPVGS